MAAWQFDFHLLPEVGITRFYGVVPLVISVEDLDRELWWSAYQRTTEVEVEVASVLPALKSWNSQIEQWGVEDGDRIDLLRSGETLGDIFVRVDARKISQRFLSSIVNLARKHGLLFRLSSGRVMKPSIGKLLSEIRASGAFRFSQDPKSYLDSLDVAARSDDAD